MMAGSCRSVTEAGTCLPDTDRPDNGDWRTSGNTAWTLPLGAQIGHVMKLGGKVPVNLILGACYNGLRPAYGATRQLRTQITLIF